MIKVAVVEDNTLELNTLLDSMSYTKEKLNISFLIDTFDTGMKFLANYKPDYDIVFLDIEMPGLNGIDVAKKLRKIDKNIMIVFVTNLAQMAINGYEVEAFDFMVKPIKKEAFLMKMDRAISRIKNNVGESITLRSHDELITILKDSIMYVESDGHYVIYHTRDGIYKEYLTLKECEKKIDSQNFKRCNHCYLVNFRYIDKFSGQDVYVNGDNLLMSRNQKKPFIDSYTKYLGDLR